MMEALIEMKGVKAGYDRKAVLRDVYLQIEKGDFMGIVGPNGGGKTTLVKCLLGLMTPWEGEIRFHSARRTEGAPRMGYLPQYSYIDRKFPITVEEVVLSGLCKEMGIRSHFGKGQREKARETIARMGLEEMAQRPIGALSGGQLQRALLGRAIVADPEVLVLDEPGTYLDKLYETKLYGVLEEINREGCAIVLVSHDFGEVMRHARSVARVNGTLEYRCREAVTEEWLLHGDNSAHSCMEHSSTEAIAANVIENDKQKA